MKRNREPSYLKFQANSLEEIKLFVSRILNGGFKEAELFVGLPKKSDYGYHLYITFTTEEGECPK